MQGLFRRFPPSRSFNSRALDSTSDIQKEFSFIVAQEQAPLIENEWEVWGKQEGLMNTSEFMFDLTLVRDFDRVACPWQ